jgi:hypothetical protein
MTTAMDAYCFLCGNLGVYDKGGTGLEPCTACHRGPKEGARRDELAAGSRDGGLSGGEQTSAESMRLAVLTDADESPSWPTLDPKACYGLAGEVVATIEPHSEADPAALLVTFLVGFGAAVGAGPHAMADSAQHPARLFAVIVGETAKARKGSSYENVRRVLHASDPGFCLDRIKSGFGSGEGIIDRVAGEDRRLWVFEAEFARILSVARREGSTLSQIIRAAWDGGRLEINVRSKAESRAVDDAHVRLLGHITVAELKAKLVETEVASGFANRHLFVCAKRSKLLPSGGHLDDQEVRALGDKIRGALGEARKHVLIRRDPDAERLWSELYTQMADDNPGGLTGAVIARDAAQVLRLSVAYALLDGRAHIALVHLEAAWALWRYCRQSAAFIFGDVLGDPVADKLGAALRQAGQTGLDLTAQSNIFGRNVSAKALDNARALLGSRIRTVTENSGGRPRIVSYDVRHCPPEYR